LGYRRLRSAERSAEIATARSLHHAEGRLARDPELLVLLRDDDEPPVVHPSDLADDPQAALID
jgi:hypothetical protein